MPNYKETIKKLIDSDSDFGIGKQELFKAILENSDEDAYNMGLYLTAVQEKIEDIQNGLYKSITEAFSELGKVYRQGCIDYILEFMTKNGFRYTANLTRTSLSVMHRLKTNDKAVKDSTIQIIFNQIIEYEEKIQKKGVVRKRTIQMN